jgi:nucleotide-binding universal stress UspA family protein
MKILLGYHPVASKENKGLEMALETAKAFNGEIFLLVSAMVGDKGHSFASRELEEAKTRLTEAKNHVEKAGIQCTTEILAHGKEPGEDIVQYAREAGIDLIIVGVRLRSKVGKLLLGSTAQYVILKAHCPVLTFKEHTQGL